MPAGVQLCFVHTGIRLLPSGAWRKVTTASISVSEQKHIDCWNALTPCSFKLNVTVTVDAVS